MPKSLAQLGRKELVRRAGELGVKNIGSLSLPALRYEITHANAGKGLTGEAKRRHENGESLTDQIKQAQEEIRAEKKEAAKMEAATKPRAVRKPNPDSVRQRMLSSAVKAILRSDTGELTSKQLNSQVKIKTEKDMTGYPGFYVNKAAGAGTVIDGHVFVKKGRGLYGVEEAPEQAPDA